jgi:hypothetical protein
MQVYGAARHFMLCQNIPCNTTGTAAATYVYPKYGQHSITFLMNLLMPGKRTAGRRVQLPDYKPQGAAAAPRVPFSTYPVAENMSGNRESSIPAFEAVR